MNLLEKIVVHHREIIGDKKIQKIEVHYRLIGKIEIPNLQSEDKVPVIIDNERSTKMSNRFTEIIIEENIVKKQGGLIGNANASKK
jgi:hypothetical protein